MKTFAKRVVRQFGFELRRLPSTPPPTPYHCSLLSLLSHIDEISIVQIGANDGFINDPLYEFTKAFPNRTRIALIEPQAYLIPHLTKNYSFHKKSTVHNCAIGPADTLKLFSVEQSFWKDISANYAKDWPDYRAPTGITSTNRQHVRTWLQRHARKKLDIDKAIREDIVPCTQLGRLLRDNDLESKIDVLQIDTEGYDDQAIYNSNIEAFKPRLINFEAMHLKKSNLSALTEYLHHQGYTTFRHDADALAILTTAPTRMQS